MISDCVAVPTVPTKDIASARRFYEDVLGLHLHGEVTGGFVYDLGEGSTLFLYESEYAGTAKHTLVNLASSHVEDDIADLREKGVRFETYDDLVGVSFDGDGVATFEGFEDSRGVWFKDPDGNLFGLFQTASVLASA